MKNIFGAAGCVLFLLPEILWAGSPLPELGVGIIQVSRMRGSDPFRRLKVSRPGLLVTAEIFNDGNVGFSQKRTAIVEMKEAGNNWVVLFRSELPVVQESTPHRIVVQVPAPLIRTSMIRVRLTPEDKNPNNDVGTRVFNPLWNRQMLQIRSAP